MFQELELAIESGKNVISLQCQLPERIKVIQELTQIAKGREIPCYLWNLGTRTLECVGNSQKLDLKVTSPLNVAEALAPFSQDGFFILEDLHSFLNEFESDIKSRIAAVQMRSLLINLAFAWADSRKIAVLLGTQETELPPILSSIIPEFWNPLPHYEENVALLEEILPPMGLSAPIPQLALSAGGLSNCEIRSGLRLVKAQGKPLVQGLLDFKIQRLKAFNLSFTPRPNVGNFGGMDRIRTGIEGIKKDFSHQARQHGISLPKGWLLVGPPGTGKTFVSKFCASILEFPMISVDTGAICASQQRFAIASGGAQYLRRLIDRIEASAPAVVYFDELDKLFPEAGQPADVQQRQVLGLLLTWLQDKVSQTFVIATLNRLDSLPPELTRLGRFDEIFYVGFPQNGERKDILHLHLARFDERYKDGLSPLSDKEWRVLINQTVNLTGAELSILVEKAARRLFHQGEKVQIELEHLLAIRKEITPLFVRDTDRILKIENIAKGVATPCSSLDTSVFAPLETTLWGSNHG
jgi:ATP-dependent 26S proteasome regulatory subunit